MNFYTQFSTIFFFCFSILGTGIVGCASAPEKAEVKSETAQVEPAAQATEANEAKIEDANASEQGENFSKRIVQMIVSQHSGKFRTCYENELASVNDLSGTLTMSWKINVRGEVSDTNVKESTLNNQNVEACVTDVINTLRFPSPKGGDTVQIDYPFTFEANPVDDNIVIKGPLDKHAIQLIVAQNSGKFRTCYENELANVDSPLNGKFILDWDIEPDGTVSSTGIRNDTLDNDNVGDCIMDVISSIKFPTPENGGKARVIYPMEFSVTPVQ